MGDDKHWYTVSSVRIAEEPLQAYNLTVADYHTYFIKGEKGSSGVWVHNDCFNPAFNTANKVQEEVRKIYELGARRRSNPNIGFHQRIGNKDASYIAKLQETKRTGTVTYDLKLSERHFLNHLSIPKKENSIFLGTRMEANKDLAEIRAGLASRNDNLFTTTSGRVWERHGDTIHPYSGPDVMNITAKEYQVLKKYKKEGIKEARHFMNKMIENNAINSAQVNRVNEILKKLGEK